MSRSSKKIYDVEFKKQAVQLLLTSGRPLARFARELGVESWQLRDWKKRLQPELARQPQTLEAMRLRVSQLERETPAYEQDRAQVADLSKALQEATGQNIQVAFVDQGDTGDKPAAAAAQAGIHLEVVKHHQAKHGFVLLPRLGGGTVLCLGGALSTLGPRLRTPPRHAGRLSLAGLWHTHA